MGQLTTEESGPAWAAGPPGGDEQGAGPGRRRWVIALVVLALVAAGLGVWLVTGDDGEAAPDPARQDTPSQVVETDEFSATLAETLTLTSGEVKCVRDRVAGQLEEDRVLQLVTAPEPASPDQATLDQVLTGCSLSAITTAEAPAEGGQPAGATEQGAPAVEPFTFGDDTELDRLWDACASLGDAFCDELYNRAPEGSEYEAFADTCGGRGAPQVACAPDALAQPGTPDSGDAGTLQTYGDNPEFDRLWDQCAAGDGQACLTLAFQAPAGSEYARFGESCGNRPDDPACGTG